MVRLLFILFSFTSLIGYSQEDGAFDPMINLANTRWKSDYHCFTSDTISTYSLSPVDSLEWHWGNWINFTEDTFYTDYSAPCGMDCFTEVHGTFKFVGYNSIEIFVKSISRNGFCMDQETGLQEVNKSYGVYVLKEVDAQLKIIKED